MRRYFDAVLRPGQSLISGVHLRQTGRFNSSEEGERWAPFAATQVVTTRPPGFDWDARVRMAPGLTAFVHDAFVDGEGLLHASLAGLFTVAQARGTPEAAHGELMRYLAEAAWFPTALLPSQGVRWQGLDEHSARATLTDGATTVSLDFGFGADGLIETARAAARYRKVGDAAVPTPWLGRFARYEMWDGLLVPTDGEVAWIFPEGPRPYWRGTITALEYELA